MHADAHNWLGFAYRNTGDLDRAFAEYEEALKLDPQHKGAHEYVGEAYVIARNLPKTEEHLAALEKLCGGAAPSIRISTKPSARPRPAADSRAPAPCRYPWDAMPRAGDGALQRFGGERTPLKPRAFLPIVTVKEGKGLHRLRRAHEKIHRRH